MFAGIQLRKDRSNERLIFPKWLVNPMRNDQDRHFFSFMLLLPIIHSSISVKLCFRETLQYVSLSLRIYIYIHIEHDDEWSLLLLLLTMYVYIKL
jgi:hypothetical protein